MMREAVIFRGPDAFKELREHTITAQAKAICARDAHESRIPRCQEKREAWMIHQAAPGLLDDRAETLQRDPQAQARAEVERIFVSLKS